MEIELSNKTIILAKPKLKIWLELENLHDKFSKDKSRSILVDLIYSYIFIATDIPIKELEKYSWFDIAIILFSIIEICLPSKEFPVLQSSVTDKTELDWEYDGRDWYSWSHIIAKNYGWTLNQIAEMDFDDAIGLMQEIMVTDQLEKEWQWSLSENAYKYNSSTKKSEFVPLKRPNWMNKTTEKILEKIKITKIPRSMLPVGNIVKLNEDIKSR